MDRRERKDDYKKAFDDPRKWRADVQTKIAKETRMSALQKRRMQMDFPDEGPGAPKVAKPSFEEIETQFQLMVNAPSISDRLVAIEKFRKYLSIEKNPPIEEIIRVGCVPHFMDYLQKENAHLDPQESLLQFEAAWCITNLASGESEHCWALVGQGAIQAFLKILRDAKSPEMVEQAAWALGNFAGDNQKMRDMILAEDIITTLGNVIDYAKQTEQVNILSNATWTLSNCMRGKPTPNAQYVQQAVEQLMKLAWCDQYDVLGDTAWTISYITDVFYKGKTEPDKCFEDRIKEVINSGLAVRLLSLVQINEESVQIPALRSIGNIVTGDDRVTQYMVNAGVSKVLGGLLMHQNELIQKEAVWALSNITAGHRSQIQDVLSNGLIPPILNRLTHGADVVRREAAWAISNACNGGNASQIKIIVKAGGIQGLCESMTPDDETRCTVVLEALQSILLFGETEKLENDLEENPYIVLLDQAHGLELLSDLTTLPEGSRMRKKAVTIINNFLELDGEGEDEAEMMPQQEQGNLWSF